MLGAPNKFLNEQNCPCANLFIRKKVLPYKLPKEVILGVHMEEGSSRRRTSYSGRRTFFRKKVFIGKYF